MRKLAGIVALLLAAGCGVDPSVPQYMQDLPRTEEETLRVCEEIRHELGEDTQVERVENFFFVASNDTTQSFIQYKATIARIYRFLYEEYFTRKPEKPIRVYLFRDRTTYDVYCRSTYEKPPLDPVRLLHVPRAEDGDEHLDGDRDARPRAGPSPARGGFPGSARAGSTRASPPCSSSPGSGAARWWAS